ncbi:MAG: carboxymuconolactone decarboxylase family protein [Gemmatimonadaceae bacterium]
MPSDSTLLTNVFALDAHTRNLVRIAAAIAGAGEGAMRTVMEQAIGSVDPLHVDEVILQSYLFAGFPRALNAARAWRAVSGTLAPPSDAGASIDNAAAWTIKGTETCAIVYGASYTLLRENIRALHPALDAWMITDGYGKVLSRPQLDLKHRELCIVAACAASLQQRQLHSHLHGALNSGASPEEVTAVLDSIDDLIEMSQVERYRTLLLRIIAKRQSHHDVEIQ